MPETFFPPAMRDPKQYITEEQALAVIAGTENLRDEILISLLWYTGARVSEIINLQISHIDFKDSTITIRSLKKRAEYYRSIPVPDELIKKIYVFIREGGAGHEHLFTFDGTHPMSRQAAYNIVRKCCEQSGADRFGDRKISRRGFHPHPHVFRHGFAMNWLKKGGQPEYLQEILGHRSYETTRSYQRFTKKDLQDAYRKIHDKEKK